MNNLILKLILGKVTPEDFTNVSTGYKEVTDFLDSKAKVLSRFNLELVYSDQQHTLYIQKEPGVDYVTLDSGYNNTYEIQIHRK